VANRCPGRCYFGDGDGDGLIGSTDMSKLNLILNGKPVSFDNVNPPCQDVFDLDGDGIIGSTDKSLLSLILNGKQVNLGPFALTVISPPGSPIVRVGETVGIEVELRKVGMQGRAGWGVGFEVLSGSASLWGGDCSVSGDELCEETDGIRYDISGRVSANGRARMVVKPTAQGAILVSVFVPPVPVIGIGETVATQVQIQAYLDTDGDGLPDDWENLYGCMQTNTVDNLADYEPDGLTNQQEYSAGTNPCLADTDSDGMPDGWEVNYSACVNPLVGDSLADWDGDGYTNLQEYQNGYNPCIFTDLIPPVITIVSPPDGMTTNATISIYITYSDTGSGVDTSSLHVYHNDVDITTGLTVGDTCTVGRVTGVSEGGNLIRAYIEDLAGNAAEDSALVLVESGLPPVLWFVSPVDGQTVLTNTPYFRIEYEDPGSVGVNPASLVVILDYTLNITARFDVYSGFAEWWPKKESALSSGAHRLEARVEDYFGNLSLPVIINIFVSFSGGNPTIVLLTPNFTIGGDTVTITGAFFGDTVKVFFPGTLGAVAADSVWPNGSTEIVAKVPGSVISGKAWVQNLEGSTPNEINSNSVEFTYGLPYAYITNRGSHRVTIFDYRDNTFPAPESVAMPPTNPTPYQADVTPDGRWVLVANWSTMTVTAIDVLNNHAIKNTVAINCGSPAPGKPQAIAISPDGSRAFVGTDNRMIAAVEIKKLLGAAPPTCADATLSEAYSEGSVFRYLDFSPDGQRVLVATDNIQDVNGKVLSVDSGRYYQSDDNSNLNYLNAQVYEMTQADAKRNPSGVGFLPQRMSAAPANPWWALVVNAADNLTSDYMEDGVILEMPGRVEHGILLTNESGLHPACFGGMDVAISPLGHRAVLAFNYSNNLGILDNPESNGTILAATASTANCNYTTQTGCTWPWVRELEYTPYRNKVIAAIWGATAANSYLKVLSADTASIPLGTPGTISASLYITKDHSSLQGPEGIGVWPHFDRDGDKISDYIEAFNYQGILRLNGSVDYLNPTVADTVQSFGQPNNEIGLIGAFQLPHEGIGYRHFYNVTADFNTDNWGTLRMLQTIEAVGREWNLRYPAGPRISIADMSHRQGGPFPPHKSHKNGNDIDVLYVLDNGTEGKMDFCNGDACNHVPFPPNYSQSMTRELIDIFIKLGASKIIVDPATGITAGGVVEFEGISTGDDPCGDWDNNAQKCTGGRGHSHHFHVRIP